MFFFLSLLCPSLPSPLVHLYLCLPIFSLRCSSSFFSFCSSPFTPHAKDCELDARTCAPTHPHALTRTHTRNSPVRFLFEMHNLFLATAEKCISTPFLFRIGFGFRIRCRRNFFVEQNFVEKFRSMARLRPGSVEDYLSHAVSYV